MDRRQRTLTAVFCPIELRNRIGSWNEFYGYGRQIKYDGKSIVYLDITERKLYDHRRWLQQIYVFFFPLRE